MKLRNRSGVGWFRVATLTLILASCKWWTAGSGGSCVPVSGDAGCNPVTSAPCDLDAGETCDYAGGAAFKCYPSPPANTAGAPFCCVDGDCGPGARCDFRMDDVVGLCVKN
jgi:hypothetical protein